MEETLTQILAEVKSIGHRLDNLESKVDKLESNVDQLGSKVDKLDNKVDQLETKVDKLDSKVNQLETKIDKLDSKVNQLETKVDKLDSKVANLDGQLNETNQFVKAIRHGQEFNTAKLDGLAAGTASNEALSRVAKSVNEIGEDITFLVRKAANHEDAIRELRKIK